MILPHGFMTVTIWLLEKNQSMRALPVTQFVTNLYRLDPHSDIALLANSTLKSNHHVYHVYTINT